jgi:hypothetical protein
MVSIDNYNGDFFAGCTLVRLLEDITMAGFTPLKKVTQDPIYCRSDINIEIAQVIFVCATNEFLNNLLFSFFPRCAIDCS